MVSMRTRELAGLVLLSSSRRSVLDPNHFANNSEHLVAIMLRLMQVPSAASTDSKLSS